MSARVDLALFSGPADAECWLCHDCYEINAVAAFMDDQWTCPRCADRTSLGIEQIIKGLDLVHDAVILDMFTRPITADDARAIAWVLRKMADRIDEVLADKLAVRVWVHIQEGLIPDEQGQPIGVVVSREIVPIEQCDEPTR